MGSLIKSPLTPLLQRGGFMVSTFKKKEFKSGHQNNLIILLYLILLCAPLPSIANPFAAEIKHADVVLQNDWYVVSADITYSLSDNAKEALQNGIPLFWAIKIKVQKQYGWWHKTIVKKVIRYRLQYHALLNMYRVHDENTAEVANFSTLSAALDLMATVRNVPLIDKKQLSDAHYRIALRVIFDDNALPLPLRPVALVNPQWYLSSDWLLWTLEK
jgi:Domain of unknown function (DUF4390)